jgi:hypothetical protein
MSIIFLPGHDKLVAFLPANDHDDNFVYFHILQDSEITCAKLVLCDGIWPKSLDGATGDGWLVFKSGLYGRLQYSLFARSERQEMLLCIVGNGDSKRHNRL